MDWSIRSFAQKSDVSGLSFQPGDQVVSVLMRVPDQTEIARFDFLEKESAEFVREGVLLGRWSTTIRSDHETNEDKRERRARKLESLEEFFVSLANQEEEGEGDLDVRQDRDLLRYLVALTLERKKILRLKDKESTALKLRYQHTQREEFYEVPVVRPSAERLQRIQEALSELL